MGEVVEKFTLKNARDVGNAIAGIIRAQDVHEAAIEATVDTGATYLYINEDLREKLGLAVIRENTTQLGDGTYKSSKRTEAVEIHWKDRSASCEAVVLPGVPKFLVGVIPLEMLDLVVNPGKRCLEGAHGEEALDFLL